MLSQESESESDYMSHTLRARTSPQTGQMSSGQHTVQYVHPRGGSRGLGALPKGLVWDMNQSQTCCTNHYTTTAPIGWESKLGQLIGKKLRSPLYLVPS